MDIQSQETGTPLAVLEAGLTEAVGLMSSDSRRAAGLAVRACLEFVYAQPHVAAQGRSRPLFDLLAALNDLDRGSVAPMLRPTFFGNRRPEPTARKQGKAFACFGVEQLLGIGENLTTACRSVARVWQQCQLPFGGRASTPQWQTIRAWRERVTKLRAEDTQRTTLEALRREADQGMAAVPWSKEEILGLLERNLRSLGKSVLE